MDQARKFVAPLLIVILAGIVVLAITFKASDEHTGQPVETPRGLVEASLEAYGGADLIASLTELSLKSTITVYGTDQTRAIGKSVEYYRFPDMVRVDFTFDKERITHYYDGLAAWIATGGEISKAPDYLAESLRRSAKHFPTTVLLTALDERSTLNDVIVDSIGGQPELTLALTDSEGDQSRIWFDAGTLLMTRIDYVIYSSMGADSMSIKLSDYREVSGIQTAFAINIYYDGAKAQDTAIDEVLYNPELPESLFTLPSPQKPPAER